MPRATVYFRLFLYGGSAAICKTGRDGNVVYHCIDAHTVSRYQSCTSSSAEVFLRVYSPEQGSCKVLKIPPPLALGPTPVARNDVD